MSEEIFLNELKNEFMLTEKYTVPNFSVKGIDKSYKFDFTRQFAELIPEYMKCHDLLNNPKPKSDTHFIHFVREFPGKYYDFIHMLKFDMKFSGDAGSIIEKGDSDNYPSFETNRIYYKSFLLPVEKVNIENGFIKDFESEKILSKIDVESDQYFHTFAVFDEIDTSGMIEKMYNLMDEKIFSVSRKIYPFLGFENFTLVLNVLNPTEENLEKSTYFFEPIWVLLRSKIDDSFKDYILSSEGSEFRNYFTEQLSFSDKVEFEKSFADEARSYFERFSFTQDDELMLKRWRRYNEKQV